MLSKPVFWTIVLASLAFSDEAAKKPTTTRTKPTKTPPATACSNVKASCAATPSMFCSTYLGISASTTTSTATVSSGTATVTSTFTGGTTTTSITAASCGTTAARLARRAPEPTCLRAYTPGAQLSSACSCFGLSTSVSTATTTTTVASTTSTDTVTVQATSTETLLNPPPCATVTEGSSSYHNTFAGCGVTENGDNPGGNQVFVNYYPGGDSACAAISSCLAVAASQTTGIILPSNAANSIDIHYEENNNQWQCIGYQNTNNDPSYFNVNDPNVGAAYGFTI